jgi:DNA-binding IclR family transcriptional regulator
MKRSRESKSAPVGVLSKVLKIFDLLQSHPFGLDLKAISAETGINKSTAYRFLAQTPHTLTSLMQLKAELESVRRQGYALDDEENVMGARCIGAPILNSQGEAVAAISRNLRRGCEGYGR